MDIVSIILIALVVFAMWAGVRFVTIGQELDRLDREVRRKHESED